MSRSGLARTVALVTLLAVGCGSAEEKPIILNSDTPNNGMPNNGTPNNGGPNGKPNNGTPNNGGNDPVAARDEAIADGLNAPRDVRNVVGGGLDLTVEAVAAATISVNNDTLVTYGTLTETDAGFTYSTTPTDRIVIVWSEGPPTSLYVQQLQGDFEATSTDAFFSRNHTVVVRIARDQNLDIKVESTKSGSQRVVRVVGSYLRHGDTFELNMEEIDDTVAGIDTTSSEYESESVLSGTITGPGFSLAVNEAHRYRLIYFENLVESRWRTVNSHWTYQGSEYAIVDGYIRGTYRDTYPTEFEYWRAEGVVTENGATIGEIGFEQDEFFLRVVLGLTNGTKITLQEDQLRQ